MEVGFFLSRKLKYTQEQKLKACQDYLSGIKSATQIARELNMGKRGADKVRLWAKKYTIQGSKALEPRAKNHCYSKELKETVVNEYLHAGLGLNDLIAKYNISSTHTVLNWIKKYNNHIELKDYNPKPEVYMANTLKTTYQQRIEIVKYCLAHDRDIKGTAAKYGCNYAQLYQWVRKFEANGEEALIDKLGKRKQESELTELERAERKIAQLEREKEEYRKKYELLKKAEELERW